jgi:hypothetical protein
MSLLGKLAQARAELEAHHEDPFLEKVKAAVRGKDAISTAASASYPCDHGHCASPRCRNAQPAFHSDQVAAAHAGWPGRQHSHSWMGSSCPHNEIAPDDPQRRRSRLQPTGDNPMTTFLLLKRYDHYVIVNDDADFIVGRVYPLNGREGPYRVTADVGPMGRKTTEAGVVNSLNEAIPAFLAYYEKYPLRWDHILHDYEKSTLHAFLLVKQDKRGGWVAYRDNYPLLRDGKPARFATHMDAQRAADTHELDGYPNAEGVSDRLSWQPDPEFDWRSIPHRVEERANWQRASGLLP